ncbi:MAG: DUF4136 domain-containing protein [Chitinophaga sp.]|uniref:hypothetical protein n=1 Tax=Chitinophaga sp. TaxID=1869181 RepID=UPI001B1FFE92|nr:hypothetical protein [Chitinophaga sp.]MBO9731236.1 DUF4136 domain-containing protein [Chitinophaga sp.]
MKAIINAALIGALCLLGACGTTVNMTGTWKAPEAPADGFHNMLVVAVTSKLDVQQMVEGRMVDALKRHGVVAASGLGYFPPKFDPRNEADKAATADKMRAAGYTSVLTVSLVNKESESRYVPGSVYAPYPAFGWYGRFWGYYGYMYNSVYSPGYYTTDKTYFLESNLYDLSQDGKLVWSGQSETYNPNSLESFAKAFAAKVSTALDNAGLLKR